MKFFVFLIFVTLSSSAFAGEIVNLKADLTITRCVYNSDSAECTMPFSSGEPIQVELTTSDDSTIPSGDHKFKLSQDGYEIEGTVSIMKITVGNVSKYLIQTYASSIKGDDLNTFRLSYMGSASLDNMSELNEISWSGESIRDGNISLTPNIIVGAANSDLSFISSIKSAK